MYVHKYVLLHRLNVHFYCRSIFELGLSQQEAGCEMDMPEVKSMHHACIHTYIHTCIHTNSNMEIYMSSVGVEGVHRYGGIRSAECARQETL